MGAAEAPLSGDAGRSAGTAGATAGTTGVGRRPGRSGSVAALVLWAAILARVIVDSQSADLIPWYVAGLVAFLVVHLVVVWRPMRSVVLLYVAFALQASVVLVLLSLDPEQDILCGLLAMECYQAAVVFSGRTRVVWVAVLVSLIAVSLVLGARFLEGLALAFVPMAAGVVLAMFAVASRDLEAAREQSQLMVADLLEARRRLEAYAGQVDELAVIEERSRVALGLEASVAATLDEVLATTRAVRDERGEPDAASGRLERLQALAQLALAQMRRVIAELRPAGAAAEAESPASPDGT